MLKTFVTFALILTITFLLGCSGEKRPEGFPPIYSTVITVLDDNGPVSDIQVSLFDKEKESPWPVGGVTNATGEARLFTYGKFKGAPKGTFTVVLSKSEIEDADQMPQGNDDGSMGNAKPKKTSFRVFSLVDPKFSSRETSPLELKIERRGQHETFNLGKSVRTQIDTIRTDKKEE